MLPISHYIFLGSMQRSYQTLGLSKQKEVRFHTICNYIVEFTGTGSFRCQKQKWFQKAIGQNQKGKLGL